MNSTVTLHKLDPINRKSTNGYRIDPGLISLIRTLSELREFWLACHKPRQWALALTARLHAMSSSRSPSAFSRGWSRHSNSAERRFNKPELWIMTFHIFFFRFHSLLYAGIIKIVFHTIFLFRKKKRFFFLFQFHFPFIFTRWMLRFDVFMRVFVALLHVLKDFLALSGVAQVGRVITSLRAKGFT